MRVEVRFTFPEAGFTDLSGATVAVVDVLRATTTMVEALANGARAIYPADSTEGAMRLVQSLGRDELVLCGERRGLKIEGYDLGNSPAEFTKEVIGGKPLVMNTTNGTQAFLAAEGAERILAASLTNLAAVVDAVARAKRVVVVCAGREGLFALEDAVCAGILVRRLEAARGEGIELGDGAWAARALCDLVEPDAAFLARTDAGRALIEMGLDTDLAWCAGLDRHRVVPEMHDRMIRTVKNGP
jgi:2-phosphosulfolactate phosphatase